MTATTIPATVVAVGSVEPTDTHQYRASDGFYYETYEDLRKANIAHNNRRLEKLGLLDRKFRTPHSHSHSHSHSRGANNRLKEAVVTPSPTAPNAASATTLRRSTRRQKLNPEYDALGYSDFQDLQRRRPKRLLRSSSSSSSSTTTDPQQPQQPRARRPRLNQPSTVAPHKELQKLLEAKKLSSDNNNGFLKDEMEEYLLKNENLSQPNFRCVMRQVEKLVSGQGVTYGRWGQDVVFGKGRPIDVLCHDMNELYEEAVDFENEHGRDLGNGWLLRHPIKKMENFQRFYLEKHTTKSGN